MLVDHTLTRRYRKHPDPKFWVPIGIHLREAVLSYVSARFRTRKYETTVQHPNTTVLDSLIKTGRVIPHKHTLMSL